jgi:hypothetical protein
MRIIVQKVVGGFRARCESDQEWSDLGKTMMEAVGELVHDSPRRFGIDAIGMDLEDEWTRRYAEGKSNRRVCATETVDVNKLPKVSSIQEAKNLPLSALGLRRRLYCRLQFAVEMLNYGRVVDGDIPLGCFCRFTASEITGVDCGSNSVGAKTLEQLRTILTHYGLGLKEE